MSDRTPPIPRNYLRKKGGQYRGVNLLNLSTLLLNAQKALADPEIGWGGVTESFEMVKRRLNFRWYIPPDVLESLLWAANMLDEKQQFWDPKGRTFDQFLQDVVRRGVFDKTFNYIKEKKDDRRIETSPDGGTGQSEAGGSDHVNGDEQRDGDGNPVRTED